MKRVYINITAYVMAVIIVFTGVLSLPLSVSAQNTATDDNGNNIIKVLDMALNKSGISASPTTIQDFLDYMHDTVTAGAQAWSDLADSAYSSVSDYVSACKEKVADTASNIPDSAKSLINGYLDYMGKCFDTKANFDAGYAKGENFRNYIMSYVTDIQDKQLTGAIAKSNKYNINSGLVNLVRQNMDAYIEEYEGYYLVPTCTYKDINSVYYSTSDIFDVAYGSLKTIPDDKLFLYSLRNNKSNFIVDCSGLVFILNDSGSSSSYFKNLHISFYDDLWNRKTLKYLILSRVVDLSESFNLTSYSNIDSFYVFSDFLCFSKSFSNVYSGVFMSSDGRNIKVWKSLDAFKAYNVGQSNIYYSNTYSSFDNSVDNSITFSGDYYMNNDYSHTTIQNNIDNSQEINETTINNITNNYITNNNYGSDISGVGDGSGSGNWFADLITGIPQLLAALVEGIAGLLEAGGKLIEAIADLFTKLFVPSEGFADPIKLKIEQKFSFVEDTHMTLLDVVDRFSEMGQTVPTITFPLSKTPLADYGVGDITVNFDWFEPYRMGFQLLVSAIMWAVFLFRQYFGIKNLVQGTDSFLFYG